MTRATGEILGRFSIEDLLLLGHTVKDWTEQIREENRVSYRSDDFVEKTRVIHRNSYQGNIPKTGKPPATIKVTERTGEYYDLGSHFNEDVWYEISLQVDSEEISGAEICGVKNPDLTRQDDLARIQLIELYKGVQASYHSKFKGHDQAFNEEQEKRKKNFERTSRTVRKLLEEKK